MKNVIEKTEDELFLIKHLSKLIKQYFDELLSSYGLTGHQGRILFFIHKNNLNNNSTTQSDIQNRFHLSKSTVSELIGRMEKSNLIEKKKVGNLFYLSPTKHGQEIVDKTTESKKEVISKMLAGLTKEEKQQFSKMINLVIKNMEGVNNNVAKN